MIEHVADVERARGVEGEAVRLIELRFLRRSAIAGEAKLARARDGADDTGLRIHTAREMIQTFDEEKISVFVPRHFIRFVQRRIRRRSAVTAETALPVPGVSGSLSIRRDAADALIVHVANVERAIRPARNGEGIVQLRC